MIKMIKGCLGLNQGKGNIVKTPADEPFSCDEKLEKRLVRDGFAEYVGDVSVIADSTAEDIITTDEQTDGEETTDTNEFSDLSYQELKAEVTKRGLKPASQKQVDLIAALIADNEKEEEDEQTDGEETTEIDLGNGTDGVE